jgi:hypothetical protein
MSMTAVRLARSHAALLALAVVAMLAGCSPEATRQRGGGPGADVGNHDRTVEMHEGSSPYHDTPRKIRGGAPIDAADQAARLSRARQ